MIRQWAGSQSGSPAPLPPLLSLCLPQLKQWRRPTLPTPVRLPACEGVLRLLCQLRHALQLALQDELERRGALQPKGRLVIFCHRKVHSQGIGATIATWVHQQVPAGAARLGGAGGRAGKQQQQV